jgi:diheme cytochrome SoxA (sulfur oxidation)
MIRQVIAISVGAILLSVAGLASASPQSDQKAFQNYFLKRFPNVKKDDFVNGPYPFDPGGRAQWKQIMEFPPYEFAVSEGKTLFETPFKNGKKYAGCFPNGGIGVAQNYPIFDAKKGKVVPLEVAINDCRTKNGEKPYPWGKGKLAEISAYMTSTSDGKPFDVKVEGKDAEAAYENGKRVFFTRRGQLGFSCASCHMEQASRQLRGQILGPAYGLIASFPVYRSKWGDIGTVDRRFAGCFGKVRASAPPMQSETFRDLQYYLTYMSNGLPVSGPGARP